MLYFGVMCRCSGLRREAESFPSLAFAGWEIVLLCALLCLLRLLSLKSPAIVSLLLVVPKFVFGECDCSHCAFPVYLERRYPGSWV